MDILDRHRKTWNEKPLIRKIYGKWYHMILASLTEIAGDTVEIGSGTGNFKEFYPSVITSDIDAKPWLDMSFDAHHMPFKDSTLSNIVMIDVLHHLSDPVSFLHEAYQKLKTGGRLIMLEPYPSTFSKIIYKKFHPEPFIFDIDYYSTKTVTTDKTPWDSNQAIPYLLFFKQFNQFTHLFGKKFSVQERDVFSFLTYPLSGGFENKQLYPDFAYPILEFAERMLLPFRKLLAFRCYIVLEKL